MKVVTLLKLVVGPMPQGRIEGSVLVTVWLAFVLAFAILFRYAMSKSWPEFKNVYYSTILLAFFYLVIVIDRWLHYYAYQVPAGYILVAPIFEPLRIVSIALILSGTWQVVWRADNMRHEAWWVASRALTILIILVASFYVILYLALAACWLDFTSLNVIADIAKRRVQFEISMAALFTGYALLILLASGQTCIHKARAIDGTATKDRVAAAIAASLLFARCLLDFVIVSLIYGPNYTRASLQLSHDIAYGTLSTLTYIALYILASQVASHAVSSSEDNLAIESMIRKAVADKLEMETDGGRIRSPPFAEVINYVETGMDRGSLDDDLFAGSRMSEERNREVARRYLNKLREEEGRREPKDESSYASRTGTAVSSLFGRMTRQTNRSTGSEARLLDPNGQNSSYVSRQGSRQFTPVSIDRPTAPVNGLGHGSYGSAGDRQRYPSSVLGPQFDPAESINPPESIPLTYMRQMQR